ncbi:hypothetical protein [Streptomyces celluloflavus]|uniref:hypothetical protein n=1 Tax=Streptomyces celluloflavus TaxID=58344 RepID=UPI003673662E
MAMLDASLEPHFTLGSASKPAYKALKKRVFRLAERGESFRATGTAGPLAVGETTRA